jgi:myo-inositol-1(or 4)-monophosphatase
MVDQSLAKAVETLVHQVGEYQLERFRSLSLHHADEKQTREFVCEVDLIAEERLIEGLRKLLPEAGFLAEESGSRGTENLRWVIDPLDGTTNFLSGLEQFSISVALEEKNAALLGVVHRPCSPETFIARRGCGLQHNDRACVASSENDLRRALIGTGFPYRSADLARYFFPCAEDVLYRSRGLRRFGSAALDLCYVAAGFFQGFWESDLQPYDVAAGLLFMKETGCLATNQRGEIYSPYRDRILVCGHPQVHEQLLSVVARHYPHQL